MSTTATFEDGGGSPEKITLEWVGNVCVVTAENAVSIRTLNMVTSNLPRKAVFDSDAARILKATMVVGLQAEIDELVRKRRSHYDAEQTALARQAGLPAEAARWLTHGQRGQSSFALFCCLMDYSGDGSVSTAHPRDPADFARCLLMLEMVPVARERLAKAAALSETWARLIKRWDEVEALFRSEAPDWNKPTPSWSAGKTYELMRSIFEQGASQ